MKPELKRTTIYLTEEQHEALRQVAFKKRTSMAELLRRAALEVIEDEEDIREGSKALADDAQDTVAWTEYLAGRKDC
ncbi:MAG: DUF6290 family protein [Bacillota bacterium]